MRMKKDLRWLLEKMEVRILIDQKILKDISFTPSKYLVGFENSIFGNFNIFGYFNGFRIPSYEYLTLWLNYIGNNYFPLKYHFASSQPYNTWN